MTKQTMQYCEACGVMRLHVGERPNHILHLLLSLITLGLWAVIWVILAMIAPDPRCTECGTLARGWNRGPAGR